MTTVKKFHLVCTVFALYFFSMVVTFPLIQQYVYRRVALENGMVDHSGQSDIISCANEESDPKENDLQQAASLWTMKFGVAATFPACVSLLLFGSLGDVRGRKYVMLLPLTGGLIRAVVCMFTITLDLPLEFVVYGFLIEGLCGGHLMLQAGVFAYISDISADKTDKPKKIATAQGLVAVAVCGGQLFTGLVTVTGFLFPVVVVVLLFIVNIYIVMKKLTETISPVPGSNLFSWQNVGKMSEIYTRKRKGFRQRNLIVCLVVLCLSNAVTMSRVMQETMFQLRSPLCWGSLSISIYKIIGLLTMIVGMVAFLRPLQNIFGNKTIAILGSLSAAISCTFEAFVTSSTMMYMVPVFGILQPMLDTACKSIFSDCAESHEQGALFASQGCVETLAFAIGQAVFSAIYMKTVSTMPGFVFLVMAAVFLGIAFLIRIQIFLTSEYENLAVPYVSETTRRESFTNQQSSKQSVLPGP